MRLITNSSNHKAGRKVNMADNDSHIDNKEESQDKQPENLDPKQGEGEGDNQPSWQEMAGVDPKEFDSPEKLAKSYKDARKGLSDQGEKIKEAEEYQQRVEPLLKVIYGNPDLYKKVVEEVNNVYSQKEPDQKKEEARDPRFDELAGLEEARVIKDFESSIKLNKKSPEEQAKIRKDIGAIMQRWIPANSRPSIQQLPTFLEDAWGLYKSKNDIQEEVDEPSINLGFGTPRAVRATIDKMDVGSLAPEERKAADRMGISYEDYLKEKKTIMRE